MLTVGPVQNIFFSDFGAEIRTQTQRDETIFCAKDVCDALGIQNSRQKVGYLDEDEKMLSSHLCNNKTRNLMFVTEPGLYKLIMTCRNATKKGTIPHKFFRWVTHDVLPSLRRKAEQQLENRVTRAIMQDINDERARRLWTVFSNMNVFTYAVRRRYFGRICKATRDLCYICEIDNAPYVQYGKVDECIQCMKRLVNQYILEDVPEGQTKITDYM